MVNIHDALTTCGYTFAEVIDSALRQIGMLGPGDRPPQSYYDICCPHLEAIAKDAAAGHIRANMTYTDMTQALAERIAPEFLGPIANPGNSLIPWYGDSLESSPTASALIQAFECELYPSPGLESFYDGNQWSRETLESRSGRPCLVVNMLPRLVALAIDAQREAGLPLDEAEVAILQGVVTQRNMDAQRAYNYMVSAAVERERAERADMTSVLKQT